MDASAHAVAEDSLATLLEASARGDRAAFARIYALTSGRLLALALRIVKRRELAEEVLQDAYVTIWRKAGQQRSGHAPFGWMTTIVRHRAIDFLRSQRAKQDNTIALDAESLERLAFDCADTDAVLELASARMRVCLAGLNGDHRQAIVLAFYFGLTHDEIASELDTPLGTIKSWVRRGLLQLKGCIDP